MIHHQDTKTPSRSFRLPIIALTALLAACAQPAPPRDNFYRLSVAEPARVMARPVLPGVLEVNRPELDGALAERALVYQEKDGALARYRYDLWSDAPAVVVQQSLAEYLDDAGAAGQVVTPDLRVPPDWALRGRLSRFEYVPSQGKVAMRLQLSVVSARDGALVLMQTYSAEPAVPGEGPEAAVAALGRATSDILARFMADLAKADVPAPRR